MDKNIAALSQREKVLNFLMAGHKITNDKAMSIFQIRRLSAIIHVIREDGWKVKMSWRSSWNGSRYAEYYLPKATKF